MKALAIDSSATNMMISARNEENTSTVSSDISMKQSEKILPLIDFVLKEVGLEAKDLDFAALCSGPGTFTGLRLAYSALKALTLANGTPIYAVPTMDAIAFPFSTFEKTIVPVVDAKKKQFFAAAYKKGEKIIEVEDIAPENFLKKLEEAKINLKDILVVGSISKQFASAIGNEIASFATPIFTTEAIFTLAEKKMKDGEPPLADYDGPEYFRKSEAEINFKN